jgi:hypothetical protein
VDAKKIREQERINGKKVLQDFILDKDSLMQYKKKKKYEDMKKSPDASSMIFNLINDV